MLVGPYSIDAASLGVLLSMVKDRATVARGTIPRLGDHPTGERLARAVLHHNARTVLRAGAGHFQPMWVADTGVAFAGATRALPQEYLRDLLTRVLDASAKRDGIVPNGLTPRGRAHMMPWPRADNAPWLLHMLATLHDDDLVAERWHDITRAYARWQADTLDPRTLLVRHDVHGDWVDTIRRPSSTYNNLLALRAHDAARALGLRDASDARASERALFDARWTGTHFTEHADADDSLCADANVPALYFGLLPETTRRQIARTLEESNLARPVPMRMREEPRLHHAPRFTRLAPDYHATVWVHLGLMHTIGLAKLGLPFEEHARTLDALARRHGTWLETLHPDGRPYLSRFIATEYHFTMSAGLALELAALGHGGQASIAAASA